MQQFAAPATLVSGDLTKEKNRASVEKCFMITGLLDMYINFSNPSLGAADCNACPDSWVKRFWVANLKLF